MKKEFKCIIFDCDGVLVDSEPIALSTLVDIANSLGIWIDMDFAIKNYMGNSVDKVIEITESLYGKPLPSNYEAEYRRISFERFKKELQPIQYIKEVVPQLKVPYCVASSGPQNKIRLNLELIDMLPYFDGHIFSCYDVQKWKPDPAVYIHAMQKMGFEPEECLVVEDSLLGVQAGIASGATVYAYAATAHNRVDLAATGATLFEDMRDLLELV